MPTRHGWAKRLAGRLRTALWPPGTAPSGRGVSSANLPAETFAGAPGLTDKASPLEGKEKVARAIVAEGRRATQPGEAAAREPPETERVRGACPSVGDLADDGSKPLSAARSET